MMGLLAFLVGGDVFAYSFGALAEGRRFRAFEFYV